MSLAHTRNKKTFLGGLIVIMIAVVLVYALIMFISNYQINKISAINEKYYIAGSYLIPGDYQAYVSELMGVGAEKYTKPIVDYVYLYEDAKKIDRLVRYAITENQCVTRTTLAKIEMQIQERDKVLEEFQNSYSKKLDKIRWGRYIDVLENYYPVEEQRDVARDLPIC